VPIVSAIVNYHTQEEECVPIEFPIRVPHVPGAGADRLRRQVDPPQLIQHRDGLESGLNRFELILAIRSCLSLESRGAQRSTYSHRLTSRRTSAGVGSRAGEFFFTAPGHTRMHAPIVAPVEYLANRNHAYAGVWLDDTLERSMFRCLRR
jgi:hypothetical protein